MSIGAPQCGQLLNPWRDACGFYSPDVVGRLRDLADGPKRLYERLCRRAGRNGFCFPSFRSLSSDLGKCERQVRSDLKALEAYGLIQSRRRDRGKGGRGQSNVYVFLWHPIFERQSTADQNGFDRQSTAILIGSGLPTNSVQGIQSSDGIQSDRSDRPDSETSSQKNLIACGEVFSDLVGPFGESQTVIEVAGEEAPQDGAAGFRGIRGIKPALEIAPRASRARREGFQSAGDILREVDWLANDTTARPLRRAS